MQADVCPPPGDMLLAISAEFRAVDLDAVSYELDDLARGLFGVRDEPRDASHRLATLLTDELRLHTDESSVDGIFLDTVLDPPRRPSAHAGRARGGDRPPRRPRRRRVLDADRLVRGARRARAPVADRPAPRPRADAVGPVRRHCGHEVGFAALTGVYARLIRDGEGARACRAAQLRGQLPVGRHV